MFNWLLEQLALSTSSYSNKIWVLSGNLSNIAPSLTIKLKDSIKSNSSDNRHLSSHTAKNLKNELLIIPLSISFFKFSGVNNLFD